MRMTIVIGTHECGPSQCRIDGGPDHVGHGRISISHSAQTASTRGEPWAELSFFVTPPHGPVATLKWAVRQLDTNLRAKTFPATDDDLIELMG